MKNHRLIWTQQEDSVLKYLIQQKSIKAWYKLANIMMHDYKFSKRSGKQCRQRWENNLRLIFSKQEWSKQEEETLFKIQREMGCKWAKISKIMPQRSPNCLKNRYYTLLRKEYRKINKFASLKNQAIIQFFKFTKILMIAEVSRNKDSIFLDSQILECLRIKQFLISNINLSLEEIIQIKGQENLICTIKSIQKYGQKYKNFTFTSSMLRDDSVNDQQVLQKHKIQKKYKINQIQKKSKSVSNEKQLLINDSESPQYFQMSPLREEYTHFDQDIPESRRSEYIN